MSNQDGVGPQPAATKRTFALHSDGVKHLLVPTGVELGRVRSVTVHVEGGSPAEVIWTVYVLGEDGLITRDILGLPIVREIRADFAQLRLQGVLTPAVEPETPAP